ncbi:MAG: DUF3540 domain-containing protein [Sandaracinaceae bacterium]|nr:DUF3540 domain-containing protein [Sandaracinaceae bacterium]
MATEHLMDSTARSGTPALGPHALGPHGLGPHGDLAAGVVSGVLGGEIVVDEASGRSTLARRAASCLLAPRPGDRVLLARVDGEAFVLAVLEREDGARELEVDGDLTLRSRGGTVTIEGERGLRLRTPAALSAAGQTLSLVAQHASWAGEQLQLLADQVSVEAGRIRQVAAFSELVVESVKETLGSSFRTIRETEHVQAGSLTLSLRKLLRAHADTALVTAKKLAKIDAEQIHLG